MGLLPTVHPLCHACGVYRTSRAICVPGEGDPGARLVLIGEALGESEEEQGRPFRGRAGWLLDRALHEAGLYRAAVWVTNAVRCRPVNPLAGTNRPPTHRELAFCRPWLDAELASLPNRRVIVALGASAAWACLTAEDAATQAELAQLVAPPAPQSFTPPGAVDTLPSGGVLENQGKVFWSRRYQSWVVQTIHPGLALRKPGEALWLTLDLLKAARIAETGALPGLRAPAYRVVRTVADAEEMRAALRPAPYLVWDWETTGVHPVHSLGFCVSFCGAPDFAWVVPRWGSTASESLALPPGTRVPVGFAPLWWPAELAQVDAILRDIFLSDVPKIGHHVAFDYAMTLSTLDVRPARVVGCTMLAHHLLFNHLGERAHGLKRMADMYTDYGRYDDPLDQWLVAHGFTKDGKPDGAYLYRAPNHLLWPYNAIDSIVPWRVHPMLVARLQAAGLYDVYRDERLPLALEYAEMDRAGLPVSRARLTTLSGDLAAAMTAVEGELHRVVGRALNPNSHKQVAAYLFDERGLPVLNRTETGAPSTREDVLKEYESVEPGAALILHYRAYSKLKGTFVDGRDGAGGIKAAVDPDGYARMNSLLHVVETFRLATRKPFPVHTIPRPLVLWSCPGHGRYRFVRCCEAAAQESLNIRGVVVPPDGHVILTGDYVQQEYLLAAIASGQTDLEEAMADRGEDVHEFVMQLLTGRSQREFQVQDPGGAWRWASKAAEDAYANLRSDFKRVNFQILYRGGPDRLAQALGITVEAAARIIDEYYERLPAIRWWQYRIIKRLRETGRVVGLFRTYRVLANALSPYPRDRAEAERAACNFPFQNGGYHVLARSMVRLGRRWRAERFPGRMLFSVHDELLAAVRRDLIPEGMAAMREEMERPHPELVGGCGVPRGIRVKLSAVAEWGGASTPLPVAAGL